MNSGKAWFLLMSLTRLWTQFSTLGVQSPIQSAPPFSAILAISADSSALLLFLSRFIASVAFE